jgi:hypothetical protein
VKEFAPLWRNMPKVVYSKTLTSAGWNTTIAREVVREEVEALKARALNAGPISKVSACSRRAVRDVCANRGGHSL